jgi:hypothetical protein
MILEMEEMPRVETKQSDTADACIVIAMSCCLTPGCPDFEFAIVAGFATE